MTAPKLTKPQIALLREAARPEMSRASKSCQPVKRLLDLGLIQQSRPGWVWRITQAGRDALEGVL